jgi:hypothetical protein
MNYDIEVRKSRDGTELPREIGEDLCMMFPIGKDQ